MRIILTSRKQLALKGYGLLIRYASLRWHTNVVTSAHVVFFFQKTAANACASVALLNIVNNIDGIELGETLSNFKKFTMPFTPALRGDAIANFDFIKRTHNTFAR